MYYRGDVLSATNWAQWHASQDMIGGICPYRGISVDAIREERVKSLDEAISASDPRKLNQTLTAFFNIAPLVEPEYVSVIRVAFTSRFGIDADVGASLAELSKKCARLVQKLNGLAQCQELARSACAMNDAVGERVKDLFVRDEDCSFLNEGGKASLLPIVLACKRFEEMLDELNRLGEKQRRMFERAVHGREVEFNRFLKDAGCPYEIAISRGPGSSVTLVPVVHGLPARTIKVYDPSIALSQGEKNVISLALFVFTTIYSEEEHDLIVLDDPVSSFDAGKRNAILRTFFFDPAEKDGPHVERNLHGATTLILTHDFPVLMAIALEQQGLGDPRAYYLWRDDEGVIREKRISLRRGFVSSKGLQYFEYLQRRKAQDSSKSVLLRLVAARRLLEAQGFGQVMKPGVQCYDSYLACEVISCLLHKREKPVIRIGDAEREDIDGYPERSPRSAYDSAVSKIEEILQYDDDAPFDYAAIFRLTTNDMLKEAYNASTNSFDRLQLCRIALDGTDAAEREPVLHGLLDESMHVSGDYLFQLDPDCFVVVSHSAAAWCDREMENLGQ